MERPAAAPPAAAGLPPGPDLPPARQSRRWIGRPVSFLREMQAEHGDLFSLQVQYQDPWVVVGDPELVKHVFTASPDVLHSGEANMHLAPALGSSCLALLDGDAHLRRRRLLLPAFHGEAVSRYREVMRAATESELERWPRGEAVAAARRMSALTLEVILRAIFGVEQRENLEPLREAIGELVGAGEDARLALLGRSERLSEDGFAGFHHALERTRALVGAEILRHRADPRLGERDDVMSLLLTARYEDGSPMSDTELCSELMLLLLAGHETTAMSLAWTLEQLARHPEAQRRVAVEAESGGGPYTEAAIRETLRLCPVFAVVARQVKRPFELAGYAIPPGVTIMPSPALVHRRPDLYPDPEEFRPERFLERPPGTYTWIPFGGGTRRCLGANFAFFEMQVVLSTLLARARLQPVDAQPEVPSRRLITLGPARGAELILRD